MSYPEACASPRQPVLSPLGPGFTLKQVRALRFPVPSLASPQETVPTKVPKRWDISSWVEPLPTSEAIALAGNRIL